MASKRQGVFEGRWGQILFAAVLLACVAFSLASVALESGPKAGIDAVRELTRKIETGLSSGRVTVKPPAFAGTGGEKAAWEKSPAVREPAAWAYSRKPSVRVEVEKKEDPRKVLAAPSVGGISHKDFAVTIAWEDSKESTAKPSGYNVYRWLKGEGKPEKPVNDRPLSESEKTYTDGDFSVLKPFAEVFYAVEALTAEETRSGKKASGPGEPASIRLPDDRKLFFFGKKSVEFAYVAVQRFHDGAFVTEEFMTYLGDPIGKAEPVEIGDRKVKIDFATEYILAYIGKEVRKTEETYKEPLLNDKGKEQFDEYGNRIEVEKKRPKVQEISYILVSDRDGNVTRLDQSEQQKQEEELSELDPAKHNVLEVKTRKLEIRQREAKKAKEPWAIQKRLLKRIEFLKKNRAKIINLKTGLVDEDRLFGKGGLLYELRWEYLKANDRAQQSRTEDNVEKALLLDEEIKDLESLLSDAGKKKEEEEWGIDKKEFEGWKKEQERKEDKKGD